MKRVADVNPDEGTSSNDRDANPSTRASSGGEPPRADGARGAADAATPGDPPELGGDPSDRERDNALVLAAQGGDHVAFRELFDRYHRRAYAVAYGVVKNKEDALDVVQEAFVKVHKHLSAFQGTSSFYTWLYRIVMNLAIDHLRRKKNNRPAAYDDGREADSEGDEDGILPRMLDANPRKAVLRREVLDRVQAALATLPEYHRQVILLREVEGLSYEEMAEVLEVPKGTIMSRLFHARRKMQLALEEYVQGDLDIEE